MNIFRERRRTMPILHFSFDDIAHTLHDLCTTPYASVFDQPFLRDLQGIHQETGAVFTLFCFNRCTALPDYDIAHLPDRYRAELASASNWLRFGFHAEDDHARCGVTPGTLEAFHRCCDALIRFAGRQSIDSFLRLGFCAGDQASLDALRLAGVRGLYAADDARISYALTPLLNDQVILQGICRDASGMVYLRSQPRLDNHTAQDVIAAVEATPAYRPLTEVFLHEYSYLRDPVLFRQRIEDVAHWANTQGYTHRFHSDEVTV